jgi:hypothetical protein
MKAKLERPRRQNGTGEMGKLGKTPKAEHKQPPRKTRELYVNVRRGLMQTNNRTES